MTTCHGLSKARACRIVGLSRTVLYRPKVNWLERDKGVLMLSMRPWPSGPAGGFGRFLIGCVWMGVVTTISGCIGCIAR